MGSRPVSPTGKTGKWSSSALTVRQSSPRPGDAGPAGASPRGRRLRRPSPRSSCSEECGDLAVGPAVAGDDVDHVEQRGRQCAAAGLEPDDERSPRPRPRSDAARRRSRPYRAGDASRRERCASTTRSASAVDASANRGPGSTGWAPSFDALLERSIATTHRGRPCGRLVRRAGTARREPCCGDAFAASSRPHRPTPNAVSALIRSIELRRPGRGRPHRHTTRHSHGSRLGGATLSGDGAKSGWCSAIVAPVSHQPRYTNAATRSGELIEHGRHERESFSTPSTVNVRCSGKVATNESYWLVVGRRRRSPARTAPRGASRGAGPRRAVVPPCLEALDHPSCPQRRALAIQQRVGAGEIAHERDLAETAGDEHAAGVQRDREHVVVARLSSASSPLLSYAPPSSSGGTPRPAHGNVTWSIFIGCERARHRGGSGDGLGDAQTANLLVGASPTT